MQSSYRDEASSEGGQAQENYDQESSGRKSDSGGQEEAEEETGVLMPKTKSGKRSPTAHRTLEQMRAHGKGYQATKTQKQNRAKRNSARAAMKKKHGAAKLKGKDVGHKKPLIKGGSNKMSNLKIQSRKSNRGHGMSKGRKR